MIYLCNLKKILIFATVKLGVVNISKTNSIGLKNLCERSLGSFWVKNERSFTNLQITYDHNGLGRYFEK